MQKTIMTIFPLTLGLLGVGGAAYAIDEALFQSHQKNGISLQPDAEGWYTVSECGVAVGTPSSKNLRYRVSDTFSCHPSVHTDTAITMYGEGTILDLNGKTINCAQDETQVTTGIKMLGQHGILVGKLDQDRSGTVINCVVAVQVGDGTDPETHSHNWVRDVVAEDCGVGYQILGHSTRLINNSARCGDRVRTAQDESEVFAGFLIGHMAKMDPSTVPYFAGNKLIHNLAEDNENGFADHNYGVQFATVSVEHEKINMFSHNTAQLNYGNGFLIQGSGGKFQDNLARLNGGNGFLYRFSHEVEGLSAELAQISFNEVFKNDQHGIAAVFDPETKTTNGALITDNVVYRNARVSGYDLFDEGQCANSQFELRKHNRWVFNFARTAEPRCTKNKL